MNAAVLIPLYLLVTFSPLILAWAGARPARPFLDELASGTGMLAFSIILAEFVLSGRFRTVSRRIGMDTTMRFHQLLARTALALALLHPFLYRSPFDPQRPWDPTRQLTLTHDLFSLGTGMLAWILLPAFVLLAVFRDRLDYRYETWRLMHGVGALLIAGLLLHHTLTAGRYSQDPAMTWLWSGLFVVAVLTLIYIYLIEPVSQSRRAWTVTSVQPLALKSWEVTLEPDRHAGLGYEAGQFAWLNIGNSPFSLHENPFSISSAPGSGPALQFTVKELGDFTRSIGTIRPGTRAFLDGPHGNLVVTGREETGIALIAGGIGIAPLLGILRQLRLDEDERPSLLVYGNRLEEQIVYRDELEHLSSVHGTRLVLSLTEPDDSWEGSIGMVDEPFIRSLFRTGMREWLFVLCGPDAMMEAVEGTLIDLGVPPHQILSERFRYD